MIRKSNKRFIPLDNSGNPGLRVNIITMGCSKNLVDSEMLLNQLELGGYEVMHDADTAGSDVVIVNSCGFIRDAKQESIDMILDCVKLKKQGVIGKLYVMGCLSERYKQELKQEIPEVDRFFGKFELKEIVNELNVTYRPEYIYERKITTPGHYAYLKVSEGCNRSCAFCAIPSMTGRYKSRTIESLVKEAEYLAKKGVHELLIIAQDLSYYGIDIYKNNQLVSLINRISEIRGIEWIRMHYMYPSRFPEEILPVIRDNPKICNYLDLPLQHISDHVLKRMQRNVTRKETEALIKKIRKEVPGIVLRTSVLAGFPGETAEDFKELKEFIKETEFERMGVFSYSHEEGTYAFKRLNDDVPEGVKQQRADELMEIQQQISLNLNSQKTGKTFKVIIDRRENNYWVGRTEFDSPEVDGEVLITSKNELHTGKFYQATITDAGDYDLTGEVRHL